ncbi:hypothetical protein O0G76_10340, partial [Staphylococcus pseudintermedius]|nr:hypothetical protein [Staphylococcus pseudintermedius]
ALMTAIVDATVKTIFAILSKVSSILFSSLQLSIHIIPRLIVIDDPLYSFFNFPHKKIPHREGVVGEYLN